MRRVLRGPPEAQYGDPAGHPALRAAIAAFVHRSRGVSATPEQTLVTAGAQQAFDLVLGALVRPGDVVAVEDPGYSPFRELARVRGAQVVPVPVDEEGLVVSRLPARARLVYVTPSHQFPLGAVLSLARRRELLAWARTASAHIVEDDYDSELRFGDRPLEPLARLDDAGRVLYVGTFSKCLSPALRAGFLVAPPALVAPLARLRHLTDGGSPTLVQRPLASLLADGTMDRHLRRVRRIYHARRAVVVDWLADPGRALGRLLPGDAGLHVAVALAPGLEEAEVVARAARAGVAIEGLRKYTVANHGRRIGLGYGAASARQLVQALAILAPG